MKTISIKEAPIKVQKELSNCGIETTTINVINATYLELSGGLEDDEIDMLYRIHVYGNAEFIMSHNHSISSFKDAVKMAELWTVII